MCTVQQLLVIFLLLASVHIGNLRASSIPELVHTLADTRFFSVIAFSIS